jgi:hypothetical protein
MRPQPPELLTTLRAQAPKARTMEIKSKIAGIRSAIRASLFVLPDGATVGSLTDEQRAEWLAKCDEADRFLDWELGNMGTRDKVLSDGSVTKSRYPTRPRLR